MVTSSQHPSHPSAPELAHLRQRIDAIDEELVALLARRFEVTDQVGHLKAAWGLSAVDHERESQQAQRLQSLAVQFGVPSELVNRIFRSVVEQVVAHHRAIAAAVGGADQ